MKRRTLPTVARITDIARQIAGWQFVEPTIIVGCADRSMRGVQTAAVQSVCLFSAGERKTPQRFDLYLWLGIEPTDPGWTLRAGLSMSNKGWAVPPDQWQYRHIDAHAHWRCLVEDTAALAGEAVTLHRPTSDAETLIMALILGDYSSRLTD